MPCMINKSIKVFGMLKLGDNNDKDNDSVGDGDDGDEDVSSVAITGKKDTA